jgi:hypothetical protein
MIELRKRSVGLTMVGLFFCVAGAFLNSLWTSTGIGIGTMYWAWALISLVFGPDVVFIACAYWMGMRRGGTNWSTWVVPACIALLAGALPMMLMILYWSWGVGRGANLGPRMLFTTLSFTLLSYAVTIGTFACTFSLASRWLGVHIVPTELSAQQTKSWNQGWQFAFWSMIGATCGVLLTSFFYAWRAYPAYFLSGIAQWVSQGLIWSGIAALVAYRKSGIAWSGMVCIAVSFVLTLMMNWQLSLMSPGSYRQSNAYFSMMYGWGLTLPFVGLKWTLCHWLFRIFGFGLRTRDQLQRLKAEVENSAGDDLASVPTMPKKVEAPKPVWEII